MLVRLRGVLGVRGEKSGVCSLPAARRQAESQGEQPGGGGRCQEEVSAFLAGKSPEHVWFVSVPRWHPAKLNQLMNCHWATRDRLKKFDANLVAAGVVGAGVPKATCKRRVSLEITLAPRQRGGDPDCYWKSLLDALVKCGAIVDDSPTWLVLGPVTYRRGREKGTVIRLEDVREEGQYDYHALPYEKRRYTCHIDLNEG